MPKPKREAGAGTGRVGIIDIGSNSIRLVVYHRQSRAPMQIFNEKVLCGLGRGLETTGRLQIESMAIAQANLMRFVAVARAMKVSDLDIVATAAVRDAANGRDFVAEMERRCRIKVRILSGGAEARLSALGVISAIPESAGVMGDLGGGSLELVEIAKGRIGRHATMPLGPLRLADLARGDRRRARTAVDSHLRRLAWLKRLKGRTLYAVGGSWRSIARAHMVAIDYPLHVIHHYEIAREELDRFLLSVERRRQRELPGASRRRAESLPLAALVLQRIVKLARPKRIVFSAFGLREGCLFDRLPAKRRAADPLIEACTAVARHAGRFSPHGDELAAWMTPLFAREDDEARRLRRAACLIGDIAWDEHPDYRAEHAYLRILRLPVVGIGHPGRAFLALAVRVRYAGGLDGADLAEARALLGAREIRRAVVLGLALRLGHTLSGGTAGVVERTRLALADGALVLTVLRTDLALIADVVERRFEALAGALGRPGRIAAG
jgi:exopolyphosphatase/guanosine-5'-triphosphate,3'-diphosphate pyrophosphatase